LDNRQQKAWRVWLADLKTGFPRMGILRGCLLTDDSRFNVEIEPAMKMLPRLGTIVTLLLALAGSPVILFAANDQKAGTLPEGTTRWVARSAELGHEARIGLAWNSQITIDDDRFTITRFCGTSKKLTGTSRGRRIRARSISTWMRLL
jgi:hypothetical protein